MFNTKENQPPAPFERDPSRHFPVEPKPLTLLPQEVSGKVVTMGSMIAEAALKSKTLNRPANVLVVGAPGSLKSEFIYTAAEYLKKAGYSTATVDQAKLKPEDKLSFKVFDEANKGANVVFFEMVTAGPSDFNLMDLYIRLEGSLFRRQERIEHESGSYEWAQIRTSIRDESLFRPPGNPDLLMNTDTVRHRHFNQGAIAELVGQGMSKVLEKKG
jgi:hypothetical protein